jgi:hypothetical protein
MQALWRVAYGSQQCCVHLSRVPGEGTVTSWRDKPPKVEYLDMLTGEVQQPPNFKAKKQARGRDAKPTGPAGKIGVYGACVACGSQTSARFDGQWCHIGCRTKTNPEEDQL